MKPDERLVCNLHVKVYVIIDIISMHELNLEVTMMEMPRLFFVIILEFFFLSISLPP